MNLHFYFCDICGKIIVDLTDNGIPTECCGQAMEELVPNRTDGAVEKHVPVFSTRGNTVTVRIGSAPHPMIASHSIEWVGLRTSNSFLFRELHPGDLPEVIFTLESGDAAEAAYAYCNLHGLWYSETESDE